MDRGYPSEETVSIQPRLSMDTNVVDLRRKRKLLSEQLGGLPMAKHKSLGRGRGSLPGFLSDQIPDVEDFGTHLTERKSVTVLMDFSHPESATDSNSVVEDSSTPTQSGAGLDSESLKTCTDNQPSTSCANSGNYTPSYWPNPLDVDWRDDMERITVEDGFMSADGKHTHPHHSNKLLASGDIVGDHYQESGSHPCYVCEDYMDGCIDHFTDEEVNNMPYSMTALNLPLQAAEPSTKNKRLTIDQEFEEYFSSLML